MCAGRERTAEDKEEDERMEMQDERQVGKA